MTKPRRQYSPEYKQEAVGMASERGRVKEVDVIE